MIYLCLFFLFTCDLFLWTWWNFNGQRVEWLTLEGVACVNLLCIAEEMGIYLLNFSRFSLYTCNTMGRQKKLCKHVLFNREHMEAGPLALQCGNTTEHITIILKQWTHVVSGNRRKRTAWRYFFKSLLEHYGEKEESNYWTKLCLRFGATPVFYISINSPTQQNFGEAMTAPTNVPVNIPSSPTDLSPPQLAFLKWTFIFHFHFLSSESNFLTSG